MRTAGAEIGPAIWCPVSEIRIISRRAIRAPGQARRRRHSRDYVEEAQRRQGAGEPANGMRDLRRSALGHCPEMSGQDTIHGQFAAQAAATPGATAVVCRGRSLTYAEIDCRARALARRLRRLGVGPEAVVAVLVERSVDLPVALLGILEAGGPPCPASQPTRPP